MKNSILLSLLVTVSSTIFSQKFTLPNLPYEYNAFTKAIDEETMKIHHTKHHNAYVTNLNNAIKGTPYENASLEEIQLKAGYLSSAIRNNAGGHYNHSLFWEILTPNKTEISTELKDKINEVFSNIDSLKNSLNKEATKRFGSGWAWLIVTPSGNLDITSTANQDNPLMTLVEKRGIPILGIDVWEHAYYLKYQNKRGDYLGAIWNIINWEKISENYSLAVKNYDLLNKLKTKSTFELSQKLNAASKNLFHSNIKINSFDFQTKTSTLINELNEIHHSLPEKFNSYESETKKLKTQLYKLYSFSIYNKSEITIKKQLDKVHKQYDILFEKIDLKE